MVGLINMAAQGRRGDTRIAHVTPGEVVIPREVAASRPDLVAHVGNAVRQMGGDPRKLMVGRGRINPKTGVEEFATTNYLQQAQDLYANTPGAVNAPDEAALQYWAGQLETNSNAAQNFSQSVQAVNAPVQQAYQDLFGRDADQEGLDYWASSGLQGGALTDAMKSSADIIAAEAPKVAGDVVSPYTSNGTGFDNQGRPVDNTLVSPPGDDNSSDNNSSTPDVVAPPQTYAPDTTSSAALNADAAFTGETQTERIAVDPATMTVAGQMAGLLSANPAYVQQARAGAMDAAVGRGLLNSSIAAGAGEAAAIAASLPIATADANIYNTSAINNMTQSNNFLGQVLGAATDTANTNSTTGANVGMNNANNALSASITNATLSSQEALAKLASDTDILLADKNITSTEKLATMADTTTQLLASNSITSAEKLAQMSNDLNLLLANNSITSTEKLAYMADATEQLLATQSIESEQLITEMNNASDEIQTKMSTDASIAASNASASAAASYASASIATSQASITSAQLIAQAGIESAYATASMQESTDLALAMGSWATTETNNYWTTLGAALDSGAEEDELNFITDAFNSTMIQNSPIYGYEWTTPMDYFVVTPPDTTAP